MAKPKSIKKIEPDFEAVKAWFDSHLSTNKCNFDDPKPYEVYEKGLWGGIFQCVDEATPILMGDGSLKPISDVSVGDRVMAYDSINRHYVNKRITAKYDQGTRECITLKFFDGGETLTCTPDHPILNATSRVFAEAESLAGSLVVAWVLHRRVDKIVPAGVRHVYDVEVEDVHTFVAAGVVVHNCTGRGAQQLFMRAKPKTIVDIAALTSIYRPGPLAANVDKLWMQHETDHFDWGHPLINETLKQTRGLLVFQEGVMTLANKVSGFPMEQCDEVRRAIMKRSISGGDAAKKKVKELEDSIVDGAVKKGVPKDIAKKMYETICFMSGYAFNKCFHRDSEVTVIDNLGNKINKKIVDVKPGEFVMTRSETKQENLPTHVVQVHDTGYKELVEVELTSGERMKCTWDHKFRTQETGEMLPLWMIQRRGLSIVVSDAAKCSQNQSVTQNM